MRAKPSRCSLATPAKWRWQQAARARNAGRGRQRGAVGRRESAMAAARLWLDGRSAAGAGSGYLAPPQLASAFSPPLQPILGRLAPHAREIAALAAHDGLALAVPAEQALPVYLRDNVDLVPGLAPPVA